MTVSTGMLKGRGNQIPVSRQRPHQEDTRRRAVSMLCCRFLVQINNDFIFPKEKKKQSVKRIGDKVFSAMRSLGLCEFKEVWACVYVTYFEIWFSILKIQQSVGCQYCATIVMCLQHISERCKWAKMLPVFATKPRVFLVLWNRRLRGFNKMHSYSGQEHSNK